MLNFILKIFFSFFSIFLVSRANSQNLGRYITAPSSNAQSSHLYYHASCQTKCIHRGGIAVVTWFYRFSSKFSQVSIWIYFQVSFFPKAMKLLQASGRMKLKILLKKYRRSDQSDTQTLFMAIRPHQSADK